MSPLYVRGGLTVPEYLKADLQRTNPPGNFHDALKNKPDFFHTTNKPEQQKE